MAINLNTLTKNIKARSTEKKYESKPVGTMLKYQRQLLNMTLEEAAEDICSVSYLSKLENNLVSLSDRFAHALYERLQVNEDDQHRSSNVCADYHHIITRLLLQEPLIETDINTYHTCLDHQSQLMKLVFYGQKRNEPNFNKIYDDLVCFISQFSDLELSLFIYALAEFLFEQGHFDQAHEVLSSWNYKQSTSSQLIILLKKLHIRCALKLNKTKEIDMMYEEIYTALTKRQLFKHLTEIQYDHIKYQCYKDSIDELESKLSQMHIVSQKEKDYVLALVMIVKKMYQDALELIKHYTKHEEESWMMIHLLALELDGNHQQDVIKLYEKFNPKTKEGIRLKSHIEAKYFKHISEFLEHIKKDLLGPKASINDFLIFRQLMLSAHHHLLAHHYYKDANKILERLEDMYM